MKKYEKIFQNIRTNSHGVQLREALELDGVRLRVPNTESIRSPYGLRNKVTWGTPATPPTTGMQVSHGGTTPYIPAGTECDCGLQEYCF